MEEAEATPTITAVEPRDGFNVRVSFSDGVSGEFDAAEVVEWTIPETYDVYRGAPPLWKDRASFAAVRIGAEGWSIRWGSNNGDGNDIWIEDYQAYAKIVGRDAKDVEIAWWGEEPEPTKSPRLIGVEAFDDYRLLLEYDDGVSGEVDMSHLVGSGVFSLWNDPARFRECQVGHGGTFVYWSDQVDSCAFHLYERITGVDLHNLSSTAAATTAAD